MPLERPRTSWYSCTRDRTRQLSSPHCRRSASSSVSSIPTSASAHGTGRAVMSMTAPMACRKWQEISTFNYGYAPCDDSVAEVWPNEPHQIQLYAEVAKAVQAAARGPEPSRLLEVCCGRGGGLTHLHATLSPQTTIGIDRSLKAIRHRRNGNAAITICKGMPSSSRSATQALMSRSMSTRWPICQNCRSWRKFAAFSPQMGSLP